MISQKTIHAYYSEHSLTRAWNASLIRTAHPDCDCNVGQPYSKTGCSGVLGKHALQETMKHSQQTKAARARTCHRLVWESLLECTLRSELHGHTHPRGPHLPLSGAAGGLFLSLDLLHIIPLHCKCSVEKYIYSEMFLQGTGKYTVSNNTRTRRISNIMLQHLII